MGQGKRYASQQMLDSLLGKPKEERGAGLHNGADAKTRGMSVGVDECPRFEDKQRRCRCFSTSRIRPHAVCS